MKTEKINIIITAGGTSEAIDNVRKITNVSTGKLGVQLAVEVLSQNEDAHIFYICSSHAVMPESSERIEVIIANSVENVKVAIENVMTDYKIDYFIHSMAISDYMVDYVTTKELINETVVDGIALNEALNNPKTIDTDNKISSDKDNLIIALKKAPKLISLIKELQPHTFLIGFKLLDKVSEEELFDVGFSLLRKNRCNLVLANDLQFIKKGKHKGLIIFPEKEYTIFEGKDDISKNLVKIMFERGNCKHIRSKKLNNIIIKTNSNDFISFINTSGIFQDFCENGKFLFSNGFLPIVEMGTYGNMSVRVDDKFIITGRNVHKGKLKDTELCYVDSVKQVNEKNVYADVSYYCVGDKKPSIDTAIHSAIYKETSFNAIIHVHCKEVFKGLPITTYNYPCGTKEELDSILGPMMKDTDIVQLYKHGLIVMGESLSDCNEKIQKLFSNKIRIKPLKKDAYNEVMMEWNKHLLEVKGHIDLDEKRYYVISDANKGLGLIYLKEEDSKLTFVIYTMAECHGKGLGLGEFAIEYVKKYANYKGYKAIHLLTKKECGVIEYYEKQGFKNNSVSREGIIELSFSLC